MRTNRTIFNAHDFSDLIRAITHQLIDHNAALSVWELLDQRQDIHELRSLFCHELRLHRLNRLLGMSPHPTELVQRQPLSAHDAPAREVSIASESIKIPQGQHRHILSSIDPTHPDDSSQNTLQRGLYLDPPV